MSTVMEVCARMMPTNATGHMERSRLRFLVRATYIRKRGIAAIAERDSTPANVSEKTTLVAHATPTVHGMADRHPLVYVLLGNDY